MLLRCFKKLLFLMLIISFSVPVFAGSKKKITIPEIAFEFETDQGEALKDVKVEMRLSTHRKYFSLSCPSSGQMVSFKVGCHKTKTYSFGGKKVFTYTSDESGKVLIPELKTKYKYKSPTLDIRATSKKVGYKLVKKENESKRCEIWIRGEKSIADMKKEMSCVLVKIKKKKEEGSTLLDVLQWIF